MSTTAPLPPGLPERPVLAGAPQGSAWWWAGLLVVAAFSYLYGLDGQYVPRIGDEMPYAQVTRVTAASGHWLPLKADDPYLENTKPPLLFWLGIVATDWGKEWTLWRLRFPIVVITFLTTLVVFLLGRRLAGTTAGLLAAVVYLGFFGTFRYGRPFLTNLPETLFVFLPFAVAIARPERLDRWPFWILATLSLGLACWVKSFVLVAPVGFAFAWWTLSRRGWRWSEWFRRDVPKLAVLGVAGLGLFLLWPLLDPNGRAVFEQFVGRENLGKIGSEGNYFVEMFAGRHSVWRNWFGHLSNVGLYAIVLIVLMIDAWRRRRALSEPEKALWILVLAFLVVYTIPTHRQENYLIPTTPALAVLMALRWAAFGKVTWRLSAVLTLLAGAAAVGFVVLVVRGGYLGWNDWPPLALAVPVAVVALSLLGLVRPRAGAAAFPLAVLLAHLSIACATHPFDGPKGTFDDLTATFVRGYGLEVPSNFRVSEERYRFLLPGSEPIGYDVNAPAPHSGGWTIYRSTPRASLEEARGGVGLEFARRLTLASRLDFKALLALLTEGRIDALVQEEALVGATDSIVR